MFVGGNGSPGELPRATCPHLPSQHLYYFEQKQIIFAAATNNKIWNTSKPVPTYPHNIYTILNKNKLFSGTCRLRVQK